jgi:SAM-dependent methyltransferase
MSRSYLSSPPTRSPRAGRYWLGVSEVDSRREPLGAPLAAEKDKARRALFVPMSGEVEFDRIAPVYDETRQAPSEEEVAALSEMLVGCRTVLDAGVGTGRFAVPLGVHHFDVLGVDLSLGMMHCARVKGITRLVRADVRRLPLSDKTVDAAFMSHVLQLIPDPRTVLGELGRVARVAVVIELPEWAERQRMEGWREIRERYRELARELGYELPERGRRYWHTLDELSAIAMPKAVRSVSGPVPAASTVEERMARWQSRAFGQYPIPPEVHAEIIRRLRAERPVDPNRWSRPRQGRFVLWDPTALGRAGPDSISAH